MAPEIAAKLQSLFVAINPVFPAERSGASLTLPISSGNLSLDGGAGRLAAAGALELIQLGGGQVLWRDPWLDLAARSLASERDAEPSPPYPGKAPGVPIGPFQLSGPLVADAGARTLAGSAAISLDPGTAALFEEAFAKPQGRQGVFLAGEPLGTVSFTAYGQ